MTRLRLSKRAILINFLTLLLSVAFILASRFLFNIQQEYKDQLALYEKAVVKEEELVAQYEDFYAELDEDSTKADSDELIALYDEAEKAIEDARGQLDELKSTKLVKLSAPLQKSLKYQVRWSNYAKRRTQLLREMEEKYISGASQEELDNITSEIAELDKKAGDARDEAVLSGVQASDDYKYIAFSLFDSHPEAQFLMIGYVLLGSLAIISGLIVSVYNFKKPSSKFMGALLMVPWFGLACLNLLIMYIAMYFLSW